MLVMEELLLERPIEMEHQQKRKNLKHILTSLEAKRKNKENLRQEITREKLSGYLGDVDEEPKKRKKIFNNLRLRTKVVENEPINMPNTEVIKEKKRFTDFTNLFRRKNYNNNDDTLVNKINKLNSLEKELEKEEFMLQDMKRQCLAFKDRYGSSKFNSDNEDFISIDSATQNNAIRPYLPTERTEKVQYKPLPPKCTMKELLEERTDLINLNTVKEIVNVPVRNYFYEINSLSAPGNLRK